MKTKQKGEQSKRLQKNKILRRNIMVSVLALILVGSLVLGAVYGFADFLTNADKQGDAPEEDYISLLVDQAGLLEQNLADSPDDGAIKARLGDVYLELVRACISQGEVEMGEKYAGRAEELIVETMDDTPARADQLLRLALLAYYQDDISRADECFRRAVELEEDNAEAHLSYGLFLASCKRLSEARDHLEKVLTLEPVESYLAELARLSLEKL